MKRYISCIASAIKPLKTLLPMLFRYCSKLIVPGHMRSRFQINFLSFQSSQAGNNIKALSTQNSFLVRWTKIVFIAATSGDFPLKWRILLAMARVDLIRLMTSSIPELSLSKRHPCSILLLNPHTYRTLIFRCSHSSVTSHQRANRASPCLAGTINAVQELL